MRSDRESNELVKKISELGATEFIQSLNDELVKAIVSHGGSDFIQEVFLGANTGEKSKLDSFTIAAIYMACINTPTYRKIFAPYLLDALNNCTPQEIDMLVKGTRPTDSETYRAIEKVGKTSKNVETFICYALVAEDPSRLKLEELDGVMNYLKAHHPEKSNIAIWLTGVYINASISRYMTYNEVIKELDKNMFETSNYLKEVRTNAVKKRINELDEFAGEIIPKIIELGPHFFQRVFLQGMNDENPKLDPFTIAALYMACINTPYRKIFEPYFINALDECTIKQIKTLINGTRPIESETYRAIEKVGKHSRGLEAFICYALVTENLIQFDLVKLNRAIYYLKEHYPKLTTVNVALTAVYIKASISHVKNSEELLAELAKYIQFNKQDDESTLIRRTLVTAIIDRAKKFIADDDYPAAASLISDQIINHHCFSHRNRGAGIFLARGMFNDNSLTTSQKQLKGAREEIKNEITLKQGRYAEKIPYKKYI